MRDTPKRTPSSRIAQAFESTPHAGSPGRFLGFVRIHIGSLVFPLPVQAVVFSRDRDNTAGGFFADPSGQLGILVDETASPLAQREQIDRAIADAARHLSRRFLN